jgi:hypothetical protein
MQQSTNTPPALKEVQFTSGRGLIRAVDNRRLIKLCTAARHIKVAHATRLELASTVSDNTTPLALTRDAAVGDPDRADSEHTSGRGARRFD